MDIEMTEWQGTKAILAGAGIVVVLIIALTVICVGAAHREKMAYIQNGYQLQQVVGASRAYWQKAEPTGASDDRNTQTD